MTGEQVARRMCFNTEAFDWQGEEVAPGTWVLRACAREYSYAGGSEQHAVFIIPRLDLYAEKRSEYEKIVSYRTGDVDGEKACERTYRALLASMA